MGPQQGQNSRDAHADAIDLTLSSPEPEAQPQHHANRHPQQHQSARVVKQEPRSSSKSAHNGNEDSQRQGSTRSGNVPQQQPRRINPQHVKQIIDTSSSQALRKIVLQLCETSPALSGAVVRGLTPYSAYAQKLIRGQQTGSQSQSHHSHSQSQRSQGYSRHQSHHHSHHSSHHQIKTEPRPSGQDAYERMKKRLGSSSSTQSPAARSNTHHSPAVQEDRDGLRVPSSHSAPKVKHEYRISATDSDDSTDIVDFPAMEHDARRHESHTRASSGHNSRQLPGAWPEREEFAVRHRPTAYDVPDQIPKSCLQCGELPGDGGPNCVHHTGRTELVGYDDIPKHTCCGRFKGELGCNFGSHVYEKPGTMTSFKRPSPSPYGGSQWSKKPRVL